MAVKLPSSGGISNCVLIRTDIGVIRGKPGNTEVHITSPGCLERVLTFMGDKVATNLGEKVKAMKQGCHW